MMNLKYPLILASKSPRRQELLKNAGFSFSVQTKETDEEFPEDMPPAEVAKYLAEKKATAFREEIEEDHLLLTSDTTVIVDRKILGKPQNKAEAISMLTMLSGRGHLVNSAACLLHKRKLLSFDDTTKVFFRPLSEQEILYYIDNYQPFDKAGAYGIQEWIGMIGIEKMTGSFYTVMGLPIHKVYQQLEQYRRK